MEIKIAETIKKLREIHNLNQDELGEKLGISGKTVSSWENKRSQPRMGKIQNMADIFNVTTEEMIYGTDIQFNAKTQLTKDIDNLSNEELEEVINFINYIKSKYNK